MFPSTAVLVNGKSLERGQFELEQYMFPVSLDLRVRNFVWLVKQCLGRTTRRNSWPRDRAKHRL
jgi:hypothetical protein